MKQKSVIINGLLTPADKANLLVTDLAIQRGYGIFDFLKTQGNRPIFLDDHLDRFYQSAAHMRLPVEQSRAELKDMIIALLRQNKVADSGIRLTLTGGYATDGFNIGKPNLIITQQPLPAAKDAKGTRLVTYEYQRQFPQAKTIDYTQAIWLQPFIKENKSDDVLYHQNGIVTECPRANFFLVTANDELITTPENILRGVIRKKILQLAKGRITIKEKNIQLADLQQAKEAFITSTTKNVLAVTQINNRHISKGGSGEITQWLSGELKELIAAE